MVRLFVRHSVNDFTTWRKAYDDFDDERAGMGVTAHAVYQAVDNPNEVTVTHDFASLDDGRSFMSSPRLKEVMDAAGVVGEPQAWFANEA